MVPHNASGLWSVFGRIFGGSQAHIPGGAVVMAAPKKKVSPRKQKQRRNFILNHKKNKTHIVACVGCGKPKLNYQVCVHCKAWAHPTITL